jgi:uncharacterized protein (DUF1697 family)
VRIADVRDAIAGLGFEDVRTYLATGNVAFRTVGDRVSVATRLEEAVASLGLRDVDAMVRSRAELFDLDGSVFAPYPSDEYHRMAIFTRPPVEVGNALPFADRGVTVVAQGTALLAVAAKHA